MLGCTRCVLLSSWRVFCTSLLSIPLLTQRQEIHLTQQTLSERKARNTFNAWMSTVDLKANTIKQTTQRRTDLNSNNSKNNCLPVRGIYATRPLIQGERIAHISEESILTGEKAAEIIRTICNALAKTELDLTPLEEYFTSISSTSKNSSSSSSSSSPLEHQEKGEEELEKCSVVRTEDSKRTPNTIRLRSFAFFVNSLREITSDLPFYLMASRDCLLITAAIFLLRLVSFTTTGKSNSNDSVSENINVQAIQQWISSLPPRMPPLGLFLHQHYSSKNVFEPLQRRVQLGKYTKVLSLNESVHDAHKSLLLTALQEDNNNYNKLSLRASSSSSSSSSSIEEHEKDKDDNNPVESSLVIPENKNHLLTNVLSSLQPTTKVCVTPKIMKHYYKGEVSALSERQHSHQRGEARNKLIHWQEESEEETFQSVKKCDNCKNTNAALRELMRLEREIHKNVLSPLVLALVEFNNNKSKTADEKEMEEEYEKEEEWENSSLMKLMEWSHFMMRSRVINLHWLAVQSQDHVSHSLHNSNNNSSLLLKWALVPFIDMLNHSYSDNNNNVNFSFNAKENSINVYTTSTIAPEQELCVHYGHLAQRGGVLNSTEKEWSLNILLLTSSTMTNSIYNKNCTSAKGSSVIRNKHDMVAAEVETIENKQKMIYGLNFEPSLEIYSQMAIERLSPNVALLESEKEKNEEMYKLENTDSNSDCDNKQRVHRSLKKEYKHISHETKRIYSLVCNSSNSTSNSNSSATSSNKKISTFKSNSKKEKISIREAHIASAEGVAEGRWLWRFGFHRSEGEIVHEAKLLWSSQLRSRIARLTDVRRKGRPGEFVLGVPENLAILRGQRAMLERERYHNQRIFPPQRE